MELIKWDKVNIKKLIGYSAIGVVAMFLIIHIYLGVFYSMFDADYMVKFNKLSIVVIAVGAVLAYQKKYQLLFNVVFI